MYIHVYIYTPMMIICKQIILIENVSSFLNNDWFDNLRMTFFVIERKHKLDTNKKNDWGGEGYVCCSCL